MPSAFLQCRVSADLRARADAAAADCDLETGTWLRLVVEGAVDAHEDLELVPSVSNPEIVYEVRRRAGTCTCWPFVRTGLCAHLSGLSDESVPPVEPDADYEARVAADAALLVALDAPPPRVEHPGERAEAEAVDRAPVLAPRDCPHLPQWRGPGGRCRCGARVGAGAVVGRSPYR